MAETEVANYRLLWQLIQELPHDGCWTADKRQKWLHAMNCTIDLLVNLVEDTPPKEAHNAPQTE